MDAVGSIEAVFRFPLDFPCIDDRYREYLVFVNFFGNVAVFEPAFGMKQGACRHQQAPKKYKGAQ